MSRIGQRPITYSNYDNIEVFFSSEISERGESELIVKGPLGEVKVWISPKLDVELKLGKRQNKILVRIKDLDQLNQHRVIERKREGLKPVYSRIDNKLALVSELGRHKKAKRMAQKIWGTTQSLIQNAVIGVSKGFTKDLQIEGLGFRADLEESNRTKELVLKLGLSHDVRYKIIDDVKVECLERGTVISVSGVSKKLVGQVCSEIKHLSLPEPYKGKGIFYLDSRTNTAETIERKVGKKK